MGAIRCGCCFHRRMRPPTVNHSSTVLVKAIPNLKLALYGGFWNRSPYLRRYWRGFALGRNFRMAMGGAKIAINLVRRANRDGHVMRSFEIPACGSFMLAERTEEHLELFREGTEAAYFSSPEELVESVRNYLGNSQDREAVSAAGYNRVISGGNSYGHRLSELIASV